MYLLAIDPGPKVSGWCRWVDDRPSGCGVNDNLALRDVLLGESLVRDLMPALLLEGVELYGRGNFQELISTSVETGRFIEAFKGEHRIMTRRAVKQELCGKASGVNDRDVRQAILAEFGPVPTKKKPNPKWNGCKPTSHAWAAVALAMAYELQQARENIMKADPALALPLRQARAWSGID